LRLCLAIALVVSWLHVEDAPLGPRQASALDGINVTSLSDPGTGLCDMAECTLREAIQLANNTAGADWIKLAVNGTITLTAALPDITDATTIDGSGRTLRVDGAGAFRVFSSTAPITVTTITVQNGMAATGHGGGAYFGVAAVLTNVNFSHNTVTDTQNGGGAFFAGPATVTGGVFAGNSSGNAGGGAYFQSTAVVSGTTFVTNTAPQADGGGAYFGQTAWVTNASFDGNTSDAAGGGAYFANTGIVTNARFIVNQSQSGSGGGAAMGGAGSVVTGSLFEGNIAKVHGGGLLLADVGAGATMTLTANRIWQNSSEAGGGGLYLDAGANASLDNNILAANSVLAQAIGSEISVGGAGAQLTGRHNTLASAAPPSGVALNAGVGGLGQTIALTNTIFAGYAVGVAAGPFSPTIVLDGLLWSSVTTPTQGAGMTVTNATTGSAAFTNPLLRNYHLTDASDAIDEGVSTGLSLDFEGDPRSIGLGPDHGADEHLALPQAAPEPVDDTASTLEDTPVSVNVLANDVDPNNDTLTISTVGLPNNGQATLSGTLAINYTPTLNFSGTGVFTYSVTDNVFTRTATVSVTVMPVNDAPTISDVSDITLTLNPSTGALPFTVGDVESGGAVTVTALSNNLLLVPNANILLGGSGSNRTVTVTRTASGAGVATIVLTVQDDQAATAANSFVVIVYRRILIPFVRR
jgi:CSLREA domain-containing protein